MEYKIIDKLDKLGINGREFCQKLYDTETVMSGSFILQCIHDEIYYQSDIDLFCKMPLYDKHPPFGNYICNNLKLKLNPFIEKDPMYNNIQHVINTFVYFHENIIIQIMIVSDDIDVKKLIVDYFDLSFCKIIYDGNKLTYDQSSIDKIGYINPIYLNYSYKINCYKERVEKYENRGYIIKNRDNFPYEECYSSLLTLSAFLHNKKRERKRYKDKRNMLILYDNETIIKLITYRLLSLDNKTPFLPREIRQYIIYLCKIIINKKCKYYPKLNYNIDNYSSIVKCFS